MIKLYYLAGSTHSEQARRILSKRRLKFKAINVSDRSLLAASFRDLGIRELPALTYGNFRYEGLDQIRKFLKGREHTKFSHGARA